MYMKDNTNSAEMKMRKMKNESLPSSIIQQIFLENTRKHKKCWEMIVSYF